VGPDNHVAAVDLAFSPGPGQRELGISLRGCQALRHPLVPVSLRLVYLAVLQMPGWLALLARSDRVKDAEIRAPRTRLGVAM
jgi:hypothetical protein